MLFMGIDLSSNPKKPSVFAIIDEDVVLTRIGTFNYFDELVSILEKDKPSQIAIDAPLGLPLGLDCLEEEHPCALTLDQKGRTAELELARMKIGCFFTTKRSIIKPLIYRGLEFSKGLNALGQNVIEVYPYATKVILFGSKIPPKNSIRGISFLRERLTQLIHGIGTEMDELNHDSCDALLSAYTSLLHAQQKSRKLGMAEEGYIVIPKLT